MAVFTCQHCNASLKNKDVEKHYATVCRRAPYLTCVDCLKDFRNTAYTSHNVCVTEDERYGGKDFVPKQMGVKQTEWYDVVRHCAEKNQNPKYKILFSKFMVLKNVPRKKDKFANFVKSCCPFVSIPLAYEVFDVIQDEFLKKKQNKNDNDKKSQLSEDSVSNMQTEELEITDLKKKKHKNQSEGIDTQSNDKEGRKNKSKRNKSKPNEYLIKSEKNILKEQLKLSDHDELFNIKSNKKKKNIENTNGNMESGSDEKENHDESNMDQQDIEPTSLDAGLKTEQKLSKKELKKLKKQQKYEAQLKEVEESHNSPDINCDNDANDVQTETSLQSLKKSKKRKAAVSENEADSGKRIKTEENNIISNNEEEQQDEAVNIKRKFNWEEVIKSILEHKPDHEMSVKRVCKKVLAEYQAVKGDRESYEQFMSKFNKKINRIIGVKVLRDRVKLVSTS